MLIRSDGLVVKVLDSQSRGPEFKFAGLLQGQLCLPSFWGRLNEQYQELLETEWLKVNCLLVVARHP